MQVTTATVGDIERYYRNTYVKFEGHGDRLFYINQVSSQEITGITDDDNDFVVYVNNSKPFTLDYLLPHKAVFQVDRDVYLLERVPARQYKRGLCAENTILTKIGSGREGKIGLSFDILKKYVQKQDYYTLRQAVEGKDNNNSWALNSRFTYHKAGSLFVDKTQVGSFSGKSCTILSPFREDVEKLIALDPFSVTIK